MPDKDAQLIAARIAEKMDRATAALERMSRGDSKAPMTPERRSLLLQQDKASVAADRAHRISLENAGAALKTADAANSLYKLARHGSVTGGIADLVGEGARHVGMGKTGYVAERVGDVAAIGEAVGGNLMAVPRAAKGALNLGKMQYQAVNMSAGLAHQAASKGADLLNKFAKPGGHGSAFSEAKAAFTSDRGEESMLHTIRAGHHAARGVGGMGGKVAGGAAGVVGGAAFGGPIGAFAGGLLGAKLGGKVGEFAGGTAFGAVAPGEWAVKATARLRDFADNLERANMQFAQFSGAMGQVAAEQEMREMQLSRERGDRRASTAGYSAEAAFKNKKTMAGFEDLQANMNNLVSGFANNLLNKLINPGGVTDKVLAYANEKVNEWSKDLGLTNNAAAAEFREPLQTYGRPSRFNLRGPGEEK